jgi:hypothetical protein
MMAWRSKDRALSTYCPLELVRVREHKAGAAHRRRTFGTTRVGRVRFAKEQRSLHAFSQSLYDAVFTLDMCERIERIEAR